MCEMPKLGYTSVTVPESYYTSLVNFAKKYRIPNVSRAVAVLYELYFSMISDPQLAPEVKKKLQKAIKRVNKQWKRVIEESKEIAREERGEEEIY